MTEMLAGVAVSKRSGPGTNHDPVRKIGNIPKDDHMTEIDIAMVTIKNQNEAGQGTEIESGEVEVVLVSAVTSIIADLVLVNTNEKDREIGMIRGENILIDQDEETLFVYI